jgi:hypothetical protein
MTFHVGFVTGATPDKWARIWGERSKERLELVPLEQDVQLDGVRDGTLSMALVRLPVDREGLHLIPLYDEQPVVVLDVDDTLTLLDEVASEDLDVEHEVVPMSLARLHARRDRTYRPVTDRPSTTIGLAWLESNDDPRVQTFIGIVRGRSARSSRD